MTASNETVEIPARARTIGKHFSRKLRREREIPAVVYGPKIDCLNLSITELDATRYAKRGFENTIFVLKSDDSKINNLKVIKKAMSIHPVSKRPVHLDFYALDMTEMIQLEVELRYEGKSEGVREGGVFNEVRREVEIECLPTDIPEFFTVDISEMKINDVLHVSDIKFPAGTKVITPGELTICSIAEVKEEAATPVAAAAEGEAGAEGAIAGDAAKADDKPDKKAEKKD